MSRFSMPAPKGLSHFFCEWRHDILEEPVACWFEVAEDGNVLRQIELHRDGRAIVDDLARHPDGVTDFGFGSLHGADFWESEWDGKETFIQHKSRAEFENAWTLAARVSDLAEGYRLSEDHAEMQIDVIHAYLSRSYWAEGVPRETVERALAGSHVVGVFAGEHQLAFARVVTDHATFAYLADVFVLEEARGQGIARAMVAHLQNHPRLQGLRRWLLATRDAHPLYASLGWTALADPTIMMQRHDPDVYRR